VKETTGSPGAYFSFIFYNLKIEGTIMAIQLTDTQLVRGTLKPVDAKGYEAKVEAGSVRFSTSDTDVFNVEQNPESELDLTVTAVKPGAGVLNWSFDADRGEGVKTISGQVAVEVLAGDAVGATGIAFGGVEEQKPAEEAPIEEPAKETTGQ
jgi:hypothetical protein